MLSYSKSNLGFTMLEFVIVVAITMILVTSAGPGISKWVLKKRIDTKAAMFRTTVGFARAEAISRQEWITISENGTSWDSGWLVFTDENKNGYMDGNDELLQVEVFDITDMTITWSKAIRQIKYGPRGLAAGGSQNTMRFCAQGDVGHALAKGIVFNSIGRVRTVKGVSVGC